MINFIIFRSHPTKKDSYINQFQKKFCFIYYTAILQLEYKRFLYINVEILFNILQQIQYYEKSYNISLERNTIPKFNIISEANRDDNIKGFLIV